MKTRVCIIGGSDAGVSAALRIKELVPSSEVHLLLKDAYPNYSICGIPFYLSQEVAQPHQLAHRSLEELQDQGIEVRLNHVVTKVYPKEKGLVVFNGEKGQTLAYDKLLIATGAQSVSPPVEGTALPGVFKLRWIDDMLNVAAYLEANAVREVVIVGAGYIGVEMAEALRLRGLSVNLVEAGSHPLQTFDPELGMKINEYLAAQGIKLYTDQVVKKIRQQDGYLAVETNQARISGQMVLVVTGARPMTDLAQQAGIAVGTKGAIQVDQRMQTNLDEIYAAGDCCETYHRLLQQYDYLPLGTTAHKQGRIAGENMVGGQRDFAGSLGTQVVKMFDQVAARTGLNDKETHQAGIPYFAVVHRAYDHKKYYPGASSVLIKLIARSDTQQLLGVQMWGAQKAALAKRLDVAATALYHSFTVDQLNELDLSYSPPLGTPWDALQMCAQHWRRELEKKT